MQFSLLSLENFNFDFKNEISPDFFNFCQFATFMRVLWQIFKISLAGNEISLPDFE